MSSMCARITDAQSGETQELSLLSDGGLLLSVLTEAYPNVKGIYYHAVGAEAETESLQLSEATGAFYPPDDDQDWTQYVYCADFLYEKDSKKGEQSAYKPDEDEYSHYYEEAGSEYNREEKNRNGPRESADSEPDVKIKCKDLIVLNLPFETKEKELHDFFESYGPVDFCEVKMREGRSRGFGFVRFVDIETQRHVLSIENMELGGRKINVSRPACQTDDMIRMCNNRLFVAKLPNDMSEEDLRNYFNKFGTVTDSFRPPGARGFAFVSFKDIESVYEALDFGDEHVIRGKRVIITCAEPKNKDLPPGMRRPRQVHGDKSFHGPDGRVLHRFGRMGNGGRSSKLAPMPRRGVSAPHYYYDPYYYDPYSYDFHPHTYGQGPVPPLHAPPGGSVAVARREAGPASGRKRSSRSRSPPKQSSLQGSNPNVATSSAQRLQELNDPYEAGGSSGYYDDYYQYTDAYGYGADSSGYYY